MRILEKWNAAKSKRSRAIHVALALSAHRFFSFSFFLFFIFCVGMSSGSRVVTRECRRRQRGEFCRIDRQNSPPGEESRHRVRRKSPAVTSDPVNFADAAGSEVKFDEHGDGLARYEILNFRKGTNNNGANGYHYRVRLIPSAPLISRGAPLYIPAADE